MVVVRLTIIEQKTTYTISTDSYLLTGCHLYQNICMCSFDNGTFWNVFLLLKELANNSSKAIVGYRFFGIALHHPDLFFAPMFLVLHSKLWHIILLKIMRRLLTRNSQILYQLVKVLNLMEILHFFHLIIIERTIQL